MATLWRAVDEQLDREVAVKLLRPQYGNDPGFAARFKQEARSAGSLSHPNIVSVYDYALGIVLYEMLTGRRPFEGDSAAGVALKRLSEDPVPPTTYRPIPAGLSAITMRALERDPEKRFPDAGSFAEALREFQRNPDSMPAAAADSA